MGNNQSQNIVLDRNEYQPLNWVKSGEFGKVRKVTRSECYFVAKELFHRVSDKKALLKDCKIICDLHNKNVVSTIGVYFLSNEIAVIVSEWMTYSLTGLLVECKNIAYDIKLSILLNTSSGLCYLHNTCQPAIVHHNLHSNNIFLTQNLVAKIGDLLPEYAISNTKSPGGFSPRGSTDRTSCASNVFSFGLVTLHVITQNYPIPQESGEREVDRYSDYIYIKCIIKESIKQLIISCLSDDPQERPQILNINKRLKGTMESN